MIHPFHHIFHLRINVCIFSLFLSQVSVLPKVFSLFTSYQKSSPQDRLQFVPSYNNSLSTIVFMPPSLNMFMIQDLMLSGCLVGSVG